MIYLVRHGEAAAGWGTHPDPGLSNAGKAQAVAVATELAALNLKNALTSPMQRCQETSHPFSKASGLVATIDPRVTEIPTPDGIEDRISWLRDLMSGTWQTTPQLVQNWRSTLIDTVLDLPDEAVVFSHFIAINAIVGYLEGSNDVTVFRPTYCSMTSLEISSSGVKLIERGSEATTKVL
jgi:broad specificity phosphatase PhoE